MEAVEKMIILKKILIILLISTVLLPVYSADEYTELIPEEYEESEFHPVLRDIRRAEVILVGSYPFAVLFTRLYIDFYNYASSGFSRSESPSLFGGSENTARTSDETGKLLLSALFVSAAVSAADFFIGRIKAEKNNADK